MCFLSEIFDALMNSHYSHLKYCLSAWFGIFSELSVCLFASMFTIFTLISFMVWLSWSTFYLTSDRSLFEYSIICSFSVISTVLFWQMDHTKSADNKNLKFMAVWGQKQNAFICMLRALGVRCTLSSLDLLCPYFRVQSSSVWSLKK